MSAAPYTITITLDVHQWSGDNALKAAQKCQDVLSSPAHSHPDIHGWIVEMNVRRNEDYFENLREKQS